MITKKIKKADYLLPEQLYLDLRANKDCLAIENDQHGEVIILSKEKYLEELAANKFANRLEEVFLQALGLSEQEQLSLEAEQELLRKNNFAEMKLCKPQGEKTPFLYVKNYYYNEDGVLEHFWVKMNAAFQAILQALCLAQRWGKPFDKLSAEEKKQVLAELKKLLDK